MQSIGATAAVDEPSAFNALLQCSSNTAYSTAPPFAQNPTLVAIRVGNLHTTGS